MSFIDIMRAVSKNIGIVAPSTVTGNNDGAVKLARFINDTGIEMARRVDWSSLRKTMNITGLGTALAYALDADFDRLPDGLSVIAGVSPIRGSVTADEWFFLEPTQGQPRYFYLNSGSLQFYPYPRTTDTVRVQYQSRNWVVKANTDEADKLEADDDDTPLPTDALAAGAIWRWRRHVGKDYSDEMAEYEAILADRAQFDGGVRRP
jgi:hypothetical protein